MSWPLSCVFIFFLLLFVEHTKRVVACPQFNDAPPTPLQASHEHRHGVFLKEIKVHLATRPFRCFLVRPGSRAQMLLHSLPEKGGGLSPALRWPIPVATKSDSHPSGTTLGLEAELRFSFRGRGLGQPRGFLAAACPPGGSGRGWHSGGLSHRAIQGQWEDGETWAWHSVTPKECGPEKVSGGSAVDPALLRQSRAPSSSFSGRAGAGHGTP